MRAATGPGGRLRELAAASVLTGGDVARWSALRSKYAFELLGRGSSSAAGSLSAVAAERAARHAIRRVPAYADHLAAHGWVDHPSSSSAEWMATLPTTDKDRYIRAHPPVRRCVDGRFPLKGIQIDESSGSSGTPYNWVRSNHELSEIHRALARMARRNFPGPLVGINAFSMGAWATGTNVGESLRLIGIVKSPGPDVEKILETFSFLGPEYTYVVTGYPPFLAELIDAGTARGFDWMPFRMYGIVGGEAMSEQLRARLERTFVAVYSAYGASDLDIGVGAELPVSVRVRQAAHQDTELRRALFGDDPRLPMVFQYNPYDYYVETNDDHELIITVNRLALLSPRIRYNIHDQGGVLGFEQTVEMCRDFGHDVLKGSPFESAPFPLPFLFVTGRSDSTLSFMGANIYPEDVEQALAGDDGIEVHGFCLELLELPDGSPRPCVHVALGDADLADDAVSARLAEAIRTRLLANSRDYAAAVAENPHAAEIEVRSHALGTGPFVEDAKRIKRRYIIRS